MGEKKKAERRKKKKEKRKRKSPFGGRRRSASEMNKDLVGVGASNLWKKLLQLGNKIIDLVIRDPGTSRLP